MESPTRDGHHHKMDGKKINFEKVAKGNPMKTKA